MDDTTDAIVGFMRQDMQREYTIPDVQKGIEVKNRERVVVALRELGFQRIVASRKKGRVLYYHILTPKSARGKHRE